MVIGLAPEGDRTYLSLQLTKRIKEGSIAVALQDKSFNWNVCVINDWTRKRVAVDTDIQLGNLVINSQVREHVYGIYNCLARREVDVVVHLMTDAIDWHPATLQVRDQIEKKLTLRRIGGVEVVEVEPDGRLYLVSDSEGAFDVVGSSDIEPRTASEPVGL